MMSLLPEEILCGVFSFCNKETMHFTTHKLHKIFYKMRMNPKYTSILEDFDFSGSPISPYSEVLATALFNLQFSKKITKANPDLVKYDTTEAFTLYYELNVKEKLSKSPEVKSALNLIANELTA